MTIKRPATVVYIGTSLDGFIARPDGALDWLGEPEPGDDYGWSKFRATIDGIVMGRVTFEKVLSFLKPGDPWSYGDTPLTVLSRTLKRVPEQLAGKVSISSSEPETLLRELGEKGRKRVYVDGGKTIQSFMRLGLIDELVITTLPVLIGEGIPLFGPLDGDIRWEHLSTKTYKGGLVKNTYRRRLTAEALSPTETASSRRA